jgi:hypothetical protein
MLSFISFPIHHSLIILPFDAVTGYGLDRWGSIPSRRKIFPLFIASRPALEAPSLLSNGYRGLFPWVWSWALTSILCQGQEYMELYSSLLIHLCGMVLIWLST